MKRVFSIILFIVLLGNSIAAKASGAYFLNQKKKIGNTVKNEAFQPLYVHFSFNYNGCTVVVDGILDNNPNANSWLYFEIYCPKKSQKEVTIVP